MNEVLDYQLNFKEGYAIALVLRGILQNEIAVSNSGQAMSLSFHSAYLKIRAELLKSHPYQESLALMGDTLPLIIPPDEAA